MEGSKHQEDAPSLVSGVQSRLKHQVPAGDEGLDVSSKTSSLSPSVSTNIAIVKPNSTPKDCDFHPFLPLVAYFSTYSTTLPRGIISSPLLPAFAACWQQAMATSSHYPYPIPNSPRLSSSSPISPEDGIISKDSYLRPVTRSITRANSRPHEKHSQPRSEKAPATRSGHTSTRSKSPLQQDDGSGKGITTEAEPLAAFKVTRRKPKVGSLEKRYSADGYLRPESEPRASWRDISRSQSPLGLIPIHQNWRSFVSSPRSLLRVVEIY